MKYFQYSLISRIIPGPEYDPTPTPLYSDPVNLGMFKSKKIAEQILEKKLGTIPEGTKIEEVPWEDVVNNLTEQLDESKRELENIKEENQADIKLARSVESVLDELGMINPMDLDNIASSLSNTGDYGSIKRAIGNMVLKLQRIDREHFIRA